MRHRSAAQALVWLTLALPMFVSIAGLAIDGGVLLTSRRQLQSVADGAARAGATRLDASRLRNSGGTDVELDHALAFDAARKYVYDALSPATLSCQSAPDAQVEVGARRVPASIKPSLTTAFLPIVPIHNMP